MINKAQFIIFLFFGFAFLVYLFPVIFVEGAKLQSGVTITAPPTTETEKICDDTIDNDNDGKIDAADEDCAAAPAGPTEETCGLQIVDGVPINYGQIKKPDSSSVQEVTIKNVGNTLAGIMIKGSNWISDAAPNPTISGPEDTFVGGWALKSNYNHEFGKIVDGQSLPLYFQIKEPVWPPGSYHQEVTIDLVC